MNISTQKIFPYRGVILFLILFLPSIFFQLQVMIATDVGNRAIVDLPSLTLTKRQLCDLELLLNDGFAPLEGFMDRETYEKVVTEMCLPDGRIWPIPIVLDVFDLSNRHIQIGKQISLVDAEGTIIAILTISDIWQPDKRLEALKVYGTTDLAHPGVDYLFSNTGNFYVGGKVSKVILPKHYDFLSLRHTPAEVKAIIKDCDSE